MPREPRLDLVHKAICAGRILWKDSCFRLFRDDPSMQNFTQRGVNDSLKDFANQGGQLKYQKESEKSDWFDPDDPFWYFAIIPVPVFRWGLFVKFKLLWEEGDKEE